MLVNTEIDLSIKHPRIAQLLTSSELIRYYQTKKEKRKVKIKIYAEQNKEKIRTQRKSNISNTEEKRFLQKRDLNT
jgi:hypothetical protein